MLNHAIKFTVIGFLLLFLGAFSLFLNMVGVDLIILRWLYDLGAFLSIGVRIAMIMLGFALIYIGQVDWSKEEV